MAGLEKISRDEAKAIVKRFPVEFTHKNHKNTFLARLMDGTILPPDTESFTYPWKEPMKKNANGFGYLGARTQNMERTHLQCHICGYFFAEVGKHIRSHNITKKEYVQQIELRVGSSLMSDSMRDKKSDERLSLTSEQKLAVITNFVKGRDMRKGHIERRSGPKRTLEKLNSKGTCPDQTIAKLRLVAFKLGRTPTVKEFRTQHTGHFNSAMKQWGSWNNTLTVAGLDPNRTREYNERAMTRESVIDMMHDFAQVEGRVPRYKDFEQSDMLCSPATMKKLFGGVIVARAAAGFTEQDYINETGIDVYDPGVKL